MNQQLIRGRDDKKVDGAINISGRVWTRRIDLHLHEPVKLELSRYKKWNVLIALNNAWLRPKGKRLPTVSSNYPKALDF